MARNAVLSLLLLSLLSGTAAMAQGVLLVHDSGLNTAPDEAQAIAWTGDLLGHFGAEVTVVDERSYQPGSTGKHRATVYLGLRPGVPVPEAFLADCDQTQRPLCWIGAKVEQLLERNPDRYGFLVQPTAPSPGANRVAYGGGLYWRDETDLAPITVTKPQLCQPLAFVERDGARQPYALRAGRFWYFTELPLRSTHSNGAYLVLCDQMHEVLEDPHDIRLTVLLYIRGVTPQTDVGHLDGLVRRLQGEGAPFAIEVAATSRTAEPGQQQRLDRQRRLVGVLRGAQRAGASIIATLPEPPDRSGGDARAASAALSGRFEETLGELATCGIYPVAWTVAKRSRSEPEAAELAKLCSTVLDRRGEEGGSQEVATLPFVVARDRYGQRVMPDNLPPLKQGQGEVEAMIEAARRQRAVPDPWLTAGISPEAPAAAVSLLLNGLREAEYGFYDLRFAANSTTGRSLHVQTLSAQRKLGDLLPKGWNATVIGPEPGARLVLDRSHEKRQAGAIVHPGALLVSYLSKSLPRVIPSLEGDTQQVTERGVRRIAQFVFIFALAAGSALFFVYLLQLVQRRGA